MTPATLQVIIGATRPGRVGPRIADWFATVARDHGGFVVEVIDLVTVDLPLLDEPENPARGGRYHHDHTHRWSEIITRGDSFVFVVPEYNNSYNAATKNAIDFLYREWADKAVGMVSYGGNVGAGTRAIQALKSVFLAVRAFPVHESVSIPFVHTMVDRDGRFTASPLLVQSASAMLDELLRREGALRILRTPAAAATAPAFPPAAGHQPAAVPVAAGSARHLDDFADDDMRGIDT